MLDPCIIIEVKAGKAAQAASWPQIQAWIDQTRTERTNAFKASPKHVRDWHGFLVMQRKGYGTGRVEDWCIWTIDDDPICDCEDPPALPSGMFPLRQFLEAMKPRWENHGA